MYTKSVQMYDALYHFKDYEAASQQLHEWIQTQNPGARTLLDTACGTGKHLEYLQKHYQVQGLDINAEMLEIARSRCPQVPFYKENMTDFTLGQSFDVVTCLFSSIAYVKTLENLQRAVQSMARHLQPGGLLIMEPWFSPETYWTHRITANFVDQPELKIAWMYTSEIEGRCGILDIHYLVGTPKGIDYFTEHHEIGLFTQKEYLEAFRSAGLEVSYNPTGLFNRGLYIGVNHEN
jgi:ubiquinone/menaquinone biosynthesis C-methylase UbiE